MGNSPSAIAAAIHDFESTLSTRGSKEAAYSAIEELNGKIPYWKSRYQQRWVFVEFKNVKSIDFILEFLASQLALTDIQTKRYTFDEEKVLAALNCIERVLTDKHLYKHLGKCDLGSVVQVIRIAARTRSLKLQLAALAVVHTLVERVGFAEANADSKPANQAKREAAAKQNFIDACGVDALIEFTATLHAKSHPVVADSLCRIFVSLLGTHQSTTPQETLKWVLTALEPLHGLFWEWSRSPYVRLRVSACALIRSIFLESPLEKAREMQHVAIQWGALLYHLHVSFQSSVGDNDFSADKDFLTSPAHRMSPSDLENLPAHLDAHHQPGAWHRLAREASREMVALICLENDATYQLFARILPRGFKPLPSLRKDTVLLDAFACDPIACVSMQAFSGTAEKSEDGPTLHALHTELPMVPVGFGRKGELWWDTSAADGSTAAGNTAKSAWCAKAWASATSTGGAAAQHSLQTVKRDWPAIFATLLSQPIHTPQFVWDRAALRQLRETLWLHLYALDAARFMHRRRSQQASSASPAIKSSLSIIGAGQGEKVDVVLTPGWSVMAASNVWYGSEQFDREDERAVSIPDVIGVRVDRLKNPKCVISFPTHIHPWHPDTFAVMYPSLDDHLRAEDVYIGPLIKILLHGAKEEELVHPGLYHLPAGFTNTLTTAWEAESNPRRKLALLHALRLLLQTGLAGRVDGVAQEIRTQDKTEPVRTGLLQLPESALFSPQTLTSILRLIDGCNTILDAEEKSSGGATPPQFVLPGGSVADSSLADVDARSVTVLTEQRCARVYLRTSSDATGKPVDTTPYWARLWRQEALLITRYLCCQRECAQSFGGASGLQTLVSVLSRVLYCNPKPVSALDSSASTALHEPSSASPVSGFSVDRVVCRGVVASCVCTDSGIAVTGKTQLQESGNSNQRVNPAASSTNPFATGTEASSSTDGKAEEGSGAAAGAAVLSGDVTHDPDTTWSCNHHILRYKAVVELILQTLHEILRQWPPIVAQFARDDVMKVLLVALLEFRGIADVQQQLWELLLQVLPNIPWFTPTLQHLGFYEVILLACICPVKNGDVDLRLNKSAAQLIAMLHMQAALQAYVLPSVLSVADVSTRTRLPEQFDNPQFSSFTDALSVSTTEVNQKLNTTQSSLAHLLPKALLTVLEQQSVDAFIEAFNAEQLCTPRLLWSSRMRSTLRNHVEQVSAHFLEWRSAVHNSKSISSETDGIFYPGSAALLHNVGQVLYVPPTTSFPQRHALQYAELNVEPFIADVYLSAYLQQGGLPQGTTLVDLSTACMTALPAFLDELETAATRLFEGLKDGKGSWDADTAAVYTRAHYRVRLVLQVLLKGLVETQGLKLTSETPAELRRVLVLALTGLQTARKLSSSLSIIVGLLTPVDFIAAASPGSEVSQNTITSSEHALILRERITGSASSTASLSARIQSPHPAAAAWDKVSEVSGSAAASLNDTTVSLLALTVQILLHASKPRAQKIVSKKVVQAFVDADILQLVSNLIGFGCTFVNSDGSIKPIALLSDTDTTAPQVRQQVLYSFVSAPVTVYCLRLSAWWVYCDVGAKCFVDDPMCFVPFMLASIPPWHLPTSGAGQDVVCWEACRSTQLRVAAAALGVMAGLSEVFPLRQVFLGSGSVLALLYALGGATTSSSATPPANRTSFRVSSQPAVSASIDFEALSAGRRREEASPVDVDAFCRGVEQVLKTLCRKVPAKEDGAPSASTMDSLVNDIASSAADAIAGFVGDKSPATPAGSPPLRKASARSFRVQSVRTLSTSPSGRSLSSFSTSISENSLRKSSPDEATLTVIRHISTLLRNLLTPSVCDLLLPSVLDAVLEAGASRSQAVFDALCEGHATILPIVHANTVVRAEDVVWGPAYSAVLTKTAYNEMCEVANRIAARYEPSVEKFSLKAVTSSAASNPFASSSLLNQALWSNTELLKPDAHVTLYAGVSASEKQAPAPADA